LVRRWPFRYTKAAASRFLCRYAVSEYYAILPPLPLKEPPRSAHTPIFVEPAMPPAIRRQLLMILLRRAAGLRQLPSGAPPARCSRRDAAYFRQLPPAFHAAITICMPRRVCCAAADIPHSSPTRRHAAAIRHTPPFRFAAAPPRPLMIVQMLLRRLLPRHCRRHYRSPPRRHRCPSIFRCRAIFARLSLTRFRHASDAAAASTSATPATPLSHAILPYADAILPPRISCFASLP